MVKTIDATLHQERISNHRHQRDKIKLTYAEQLDRVPDGVFVLFEPSATPYLVRGAQILPWSFAGYGQPITRMDALVQVLTPRSIVQAIAHGYAPGVHPSAQSAES